jgi:signal transduction histidine kinase
LHGLEERLRAMDGTLSVESKPGEGTHLVARIPLHENEQEETGEAGADSEPADEE